MSLQGKTKPPHISLVSGEPSELARSWCLNGAPRCQVWQRGGHHVAKYGNVGVLPGAPRRGKYSEIHATVVKNQGSKGLRPRWVWDAARVDFLIDFGFLLGGPGTFFLIFFFS